MSDHTIGNAAAGTADLGNPVKIGGRYDTTPVTLTTGQRGDLQLTTRGAAWVSIFAQDSITPVFSTPAVLADTTSNPTLSQFQSFQMVYNGTTWDRLRTAIGDAQGSGGLLGIGPMIYNGSTYDRIRSILGDAQAGTGIIATALVGYNGSTYDRLRSTTTNGLVVDVSRVQGTVTVDTELAAAAALADSTSNPTIPAVGAFGMTWNTSTWNRMRDANVGADAASGIGVLETHSLVWNGASYDRTRFPSADAQTLGALGTAQLIFNGTNWDRTRSIINANNTTGTGIVAAGILAQFDDVAPTAITENQFGNLRMSTNRNLYGTIRDAAGNERGVNVTASNELLVNVNNTVTVGTHAVTGSGTFTVAGAKTNNNAAPGATNVGTLPAVANAAAQTWTEGNQVALSTDLSGNLRVTGSLSVGGTTDNSTFTAGTTTGTPSMGFFHSTIDTVTDGRAAALAIDSKRNLFTVLRDAAGNARGANVTASNELLVNVNNAVNTNTTLSRYSSPVSTFLQTSATGNGNGTPFQVDGFSTVILSITASVAMSGGTTINFEVSSDAITYVPVQAVNVGTNTIASTTTAVGDWQLDTTGYSWLRARISAYSAGTINIQGYRIAIPATSKVVNANIISNTVTNQSTNIAQLAGTTTSVNSGTKDAGTLRVVLATDQPQLTNKLLVTPDANSAVNVSQINGVTTLMGNGVTGTGSIRVTIASDNTAFSVNAAATLAAETTKVIGTVNIAASQTIAVTNTGTFATQSTLAAETTKVIGVTRSADGAGNLLLSAANALNSTGAGLLATQAIAQFDDVAPTSITENQFGNLRMSANRNLYGTIRDAAGNERGVNVTAANELLVSVNNSTLAVTQSGSWSLAANQSTNIAQINAVTPLMGNGVTGTGSLRVTIASDNTAFAVNSTLSAETTKVIGVTRTADGAGNLLTSTTNALDVNLKTSALTNLSTNIAQINAVTPLMGNGITGTGSLRVTIASDNTAFAVNATLSAETTKVIGVVRTADGAGNLLLSAANALNSTGAGILAAQMVGQFDDVAPTAITENQFGNLRMSTNRNLYGTIRDAAGNERGVNVTASNEMLVNVNNTVTVASHAVTNAGTFAVQATLAAETTKVIGTVNIAASQTIAVTNTGTFAVQADTELPAAASLADATSNPSTPSVGVLNLVFNGTTWDRVRSIQATTDGSAATGIASSGVMAYNGTTYDRVRTVVIGDAIAGTGILAAGNFGYNGTTYDRLRTGTTIGALQSAPMPSAYQQPTSLTATVSSAATFFTQDTSTTGRWISLQITADASANTVIWEASDDNSTWVGFQLTKASDGTSVSSSTTTGMFFGPVPSQYVRARVSTFVSGNTTVAVVFHATPGGGASSSGGGGGGSTTTTYNVTPPTLSDGSTSALQSDVNGNLKTSVATLLAGENLTYNRNMTLEAYSFNNISTATTTTVKSGAGYLQSIVVNTSAAGTITVYDNTAGSGTKIATLKTSINEGTYVYDLAFSTGLTIVTAAASDITVTYL